jgi:hypothetical protein
VQQGLGRIGAGVDAEQDGRLAGVERERLSARAVLLPGAVEALDDRAVVGAVDLTVLDPELEAGEGGVGLDGVERSVHLRGVDAVTDAVEDLGHAGLLEDGRAPLGAGCGGAPDGRRDGGCGEQELAKLPAGEHEQAHRGGGDHGGGALPAGGEQADLAEEVAGLQSPDALSVAEDVGRARDHDEELLRVAALPGDLGADLDPDLVSQAGDVPAPAPGTGANSGIEVMVFRSTVACFRLRVAEEGGRSTVGCAAARGCGPAPRCR